MWRTAALLLTTVAPMAAEAFDWSARVGVDYTRDDRWSQTIDRETYPRLDLSVGLDAYGAIYRPDIATFSLNGEYHRLSFDRPTERTVQDSILYRGRLSLLPGRGNPFHLDLNASRSDESYERLETTVSGSGLTTQWGATASYSDANRPSLLLGFQQIDIDRTFPNGLESSRSLQTVTGAVREGTGVFSYDARYRGNFSEGSFATEDFADHRVDLTATSRVGAAWRVSLGDLYFLREPTVLSAFDRRQEFNAFGAHVHHDMGGGENQRFTFRYNHAIQESPLATTLERADQRLEYSLQKNLDAPSWRIIANADVSHIQDRLGTDEEVATGETVGAVVYWRRDPSVPGLFELRGGPSIGYVQPLRRDGFFGFGALAGGVYEATVAPANLRFGYTVDFRSDLRSEGSSLTQTANASASRPVRGGMATGSLQASSSRNDSDLLGVRLGRSVLAEGAYRYGSYDARLQIGLTDSVNPSLDQSVSGDGLIVAPYDSHTRYVQVAGSAGFTRSIRGQAQIRFSAVEMPDRPSSTEVDARAGIFFNYGALQLSVEDRFTITSLGDDEMRVNQVLIRLYRAFGSRY